MKCFHCGTTLPSGALFCGECGRSVSAQAEAEVAPRELHCEQCGSPMALSDIFCGECGFVSRSISEAFSPQTHTSPHRTSPPRSDPRDDLASQATRIIEPIVTAAPAVDPIADPDEQDALAVRHDEPSAPQPARSVIRHFDPSYDGAGEAEDLEATRIVSRASGERFVLQFSTGESVTVHGSGLVGRNPQPEPGELFDHLVRILDTGKSVSKTHLEFGQEGGAFWVRDRFSGNGTVIKEPEQRARRAEASRRYRVARGTRVDIGEQFFVVS